MDVASSDSPFRLRDLIALVHDTGPEDVPEHLVDEAKSILLDALACSIASRGKGSASSPFPQEFRSGSHHRVVWANSTQFSAPDATFLNCYYQSWLDFDAIQYGAGHAAAVLLPPLMALFDIDLIDSRRVLLAYVVGTETMAVLGETLAAESRRRGYHPSSTLGAVACALACAWALGADERCLADAASLAASTSYGVLANLDTAARPVQLANTARNGLVTAATAIASSQRMFSADHWLQRLRILAGSGAEPPRRWASPWALDDSHTFLKTYPACGFIPPTVTEVSSALAAAQVDPRRVRHMVVELPPLLAAPVAVGRPATVNEARFSLRYALALLLTFGCPAAHHYSLDYVASSELGAAMSKISIEVSEGQPAPGGRTPNGGRLSVEVVGGTDVTIHLQIPSFIKPYDMWAVAEHKFRAEAACVEMTDASEGCVTAVRGFEACTSTQWRVATNLPIPPLPRGRTRC
jgi:2-methylcitrate dehydratase PrpD